MSLDCVLRELNIIEIKGLLNTEFDPFSKTYYGETYFDLMLRNGYLECIKIVFYKYPSSINYKHFYIVIRYGHLDCFKYFIEKGFNVYHKNSHGSTPLIKASFWGHYDIVCEILRINNDNIIKFNN